MPQTRRKRETRKDEVIQIRASAKDKALITSAAAQRGQKLSEYMLESSRRRAEDDLLDQRVFFLGPKEHEELLAILDDPPKPSRELVALFRRKRLWES